MAPSAGDSSSSGATSERKALAVLGEAPAFLSSDDSGWEFDEQAPRAKTPHAIMTANDFTVLS
jgi:hypothetical protein